MGLLGGSFNPAHDGHLHVSEQALRLLALDRVWWLVSPQNPLKDVAGMAPFAERLEGARALARGARILVSDLEARLGTRYTADTLPLLRARFPAIDFVWLMGADNLAELSRWHDWPRIFHTVPIAIFNRPSYSVRALAGEAARRFRVHRVEGSQAATLAGRRPPAWVFLWATHHRASATAMRARAGRPARDRGGRLGATGSGDEGHR